MGSPEAVATLYSEIYRTLPQYSMTKWRQKALRLLLKTEYKNGAREYMDVGCGRGESLRIADKIGFTSWGLEIVPELCNQPNIYLIDTAAFLPNEDEVVDVVSAMDVLEHLTPDDAIESAFEMHRVSRICVLLGIPSYSSKYMGTELHLTIRPWLWWLNQLSRIDRTVVIPGMRVPREKMPYTFFRMG